MAERSLKFNRIPTMTLEPLLQAPLAIQIHVAAVTPAALLGAYILLRPKGTRRHKALGRIWMILMVVTALSSFFIHEIDLFFGFGPIHLLSTATLFGSWQAIAAARRRDIRTHKRIVKGLYFGGVVSAGLFTLVPGRIMNEVIFSGNDTASAMAGIGLVTIGAILVLRPRLKLFA
ncbi:DUF2306 domain-containing protein [Rhizobium sullae]|uniref:DUF2306 domain-containing protein n=1 Tax=Rhizobium sullae TaxID=50338 RepID=A0A2N0D4Z6_RHISU|nr:DUF2306 domain-containing protein [Rhizobium sullae]PKA41160.1 DUF2306 domain-containing protein [Rhizobium sullae]UWU12720.1 DUF2306 domain-containing protein [Rhizobium sullae]